MENPYVYKLDKLKKKLVKDGHTLSQKMMKMNGELLWKYNLKQQSIIY